MKDSLFERTVSHFRAVSAGLQTAPILLPHELEASEAKMDMFIHCTGAHVHYGSGIACYQRSTDTIYMPYREHLEQFYTIHFHELVHWSGARHRLNRPHQGNTWQDAYRFEEFVAEMGANYLLEEFGVPASEASFHYFTAYAENGYDAEALLSKATDDARRAADYLLSLSARNSNRV